MNTSRRGFLGALFGAVAIAATKDPEELLFRPGAKLISIPYGLKLLPPKVVAPEETIVIAELVPVDVGATVDLQKPLRYVYRSSKVGIQSVYDVNGVAFTREQILMASGLDHSQCRGLLKATPR